MRLSQSVVPTCKACDSSDGAAVDCLLVKAKFQAGENVALCGRFSVIGMESHVARILCLSPASQMAQKLAALSLVATCPSGVTTCLNQTTPVDEVVELEFKLRFVTSPCRQAAASGWSDSTVFYVGYAVTISRTCQTTCRDTAKHDVLLTKEAATQTLDKRT